MRVLVGLVFLLLTLAGVAGGVYMGTLFTKDLLNIFFCGIGGLILVGLPCGGYYSHMFPPQKCPRCGHDLSEVNVTSCRG